ncbi:hypothetical protein Tsubulata_029730 [Turnera subulata]|uniref:Filament-like plant protein n=1 Tax=Turnera subulata TaxID=218843 RepID=A0A9Q0JJ09_9ROSI|nr:hypothetical protein Tsubulata_029730 [Turnera subulata]
MDRRSWLWRRKSSEKSPGETESCGSISSHSERFSDDQAYPAHTPQSPEVISKVSPTEDADDTVKILRDKLSAALLNISAKEDLARQHAKVAEEAVLGWENAEREVLVLKQQLEDATKKNSALEDRVGHLDAALKECMRQLRQAREEQEQRINEALSKRTSEWESTKLELEARLVELQIQLQTAKAEATSSAESDFRQKLEAAERENSSLRRKLLSHAEELELSILERDLSTQSAEMASKLHLENIKKVTKLEAECRRLKAMARKVSPATDHKSLAASSICVESFTDSQSDIGERLLAVENDAHKTISSEMNEPSCSGSLAPVLISEVDQLKNQKVIGRNMMVPSVEINLMDDFLEMERLAALPDAESANSHLQSGLLSDEANSRESQWKAELQLMIHRTAELEEKIDKIEEEKMKSEVMLTECQKQVEILQRQLKETDAQLLEQKAQLDLANESNQARTEEIKRIAEKKNWMESQLKIAEAEIKNLLSKVSSLDEQVIEERALSEEKEAQCRKLEDELSKIKREAELQKKTELSRVARSNEELKIKQEKELALAASKFAECQKTISSLGRQLKSLATLEDLLLDSEKSSDVTSEGLKKKW